MTDAAQPSPLIDPFTYKRALARIVAEVPRGTDREAVVRHYRAAVVELTLDGSITLEQGDDLERMLVEVLETLPP